MLIPKKVLIIGSADFVQYQKTKSNTVVDKTLSDYVLAVNSTYTTLYIFENKSRGSIEAIRDKKIESLTGIHTAITYDIPNAELKRIGRILSIQYSTDWWEDSFFKYEHVFDKPMPFFANRQTGFNVMAIKSVRGKILTQEGITG